MELLNQFPDFTFKPSPEDYFYWRPQERTIYYSPQRITTELGQFLLLHEIGHALLHTQKPDDSEFYRIEREAWDVARVLADKLGIKRQEAFISKFLREMKALGY